ncbi:hypothetical protein MWH28_07770 [Natroniella sulfidigena]|uniref:hypothetical protein n=1 Tax=Natroniella sulfidigena TaxID=723921 RepID=UPI00200ABF41|nr:hypothetical protein [Natroniella sulfidigena]MCK8817257.1 hypothetical protein [Natroniella sulfidigena]
MKKLFFLVLIILLFVTPTLASGSITRNNSEPANLVIYQSNRWSPMAKWDLTNLSLPQEATISKLKVEWDIFTNLSTQEYTGLTVVVSNQKKEVELNIDQFVAEGTTTAFNGASIEQEWSIRYYVEELKYEGNYFALTPTLKIYYEVD